MLGIIDYEIPFIEKHGKIYKDKNDYCEGILYYYKKYIFGVCSFDIILSTQVSKWIQRINNEYENEKILIIDEFLINENGIYKNIKKERILINYEKYKEKFFDMRIPENCIDQWLDIEVEKFRGEYKMYGNSEKIFLIYII